MNHTSVFFWLAAEDRPAHWTPCGCAVIFASLAPLPPALAAQTASSWIIGLGAKSRYGIHVLEQAMYDPVYASAVEKKLLLVFVLSDIIHTWYASESGPLWWTRQWRLGTSSTGSLSKNPKGIAA